MKRGDVRQDWNAEFLPDASQSFQGPEPHASGRTIQSDEVRSCLHQLPCCLERRRNKNLAIVLQGFPNTDDGNAHGLPNRPHVIRPIGADARRSAFHGGPRHTCHGGGISKGSAGVRLARHQEFSPERGLKSFERVHEIPRYFCGGVL